MVDLPLPVGPVTRMIPSGRAIIRRSPASASPASPSRSRATTPLCRSSTRSTMFSPWMVGSDETRKSMSRPETDSEIRPSCGTRRSAMFIDAITLSRTAIAAQWSRCRLRI